MRACARVLREKDRSRRDALVKASSCSSWFHEQNAYKLFAVCRETFCEPSFIGARPAS